MSADKHPCRPSDADDDGRADRHPRGADRGQHAGDRSGRFAWFEQNVIATVPMLYPGAGRQVYPGFLQLAGFMSMNLGNHLISHWEMFKHLVQGDGESADATKDFYDEYRSVCDMTAEFYLQTVEVVFQRHALPKGELMHRGQPVDPAAITRHRAAGDRGRARRYFGHRPDQGGARPRDRRCRRRRSTIISPRASAITASSTAASGAPGSRRWSRNGSPGTVSRAARDANPRAAGAAGRRRGPS